MSSVTTAHAPKGLEGVVATTSGICYIDGDQGVLAYRGIDIHELADHSTFEETCYLLWSGRLPTRNELKEIRDRLAEERKLDPAIISLLRSAPKHVVPMDVLRTAVSALSFYDAEEKNNDHEANLHKSIRLTSQIAMIVAAYDRIRKGKPIVEPDRSLSHAANFLLMLNGTQPTPIAERALDIALILHADHELNASTFAARVTAATLSDMHSAITSAVGCLKGPLHGGANEAVFHILQVIDSSDSDPVEYVKGMLAEKKKIPGFGHRVYHTEDPRATHLRQMSKDLGNSSGQNKWFEMSHAIEQFVKADKKLNANVDFYSASTYHTLGIDVDLFTPVFAISRVSGWTAHVIEQLDDNRLIRPRADYIGPAYPQPWVPMEKR
ncbi:MAG TPA: citrate synthase [Terriglobales bacterium]|nr:citrate synthase [Terriglobales bacterium]